MLPAHKVYTNEEGTIVPSVTQILSILSKPALVPWANKLGLGGQKYHDVIKRANDVGSLAHYFISCDIKNQDRDLTLIGDYPVELVDEAGKYFQAYENFRDQLGVNFTHSELSFVSAWGYGGTIDALGEIKGERFIFDFKTSAGVYLEHKIQIVAYTRWLISECREEFSDPLVGLMIVKLNSDGSFETHPISQKEFGLLGQIFGYCLRLYELLEEYKNYEKSKKEDQINPA